MRKKMILILLTGLVLLLSSSLLVGFRTVKALNTSSGAWIPVYPISITSPSNITYTSDLITLNVTDSALYGTKAEMVYSIDGKNNVTIPLVTSRMEGSPGPIFPITIVGVVALPKLPEGAHSLTVYATFQFSRFTGFDNRTVYFTINNRTAPIISNMYLENKTYSQSNLPLNFTINKPTSWIGYSLDGQTNVTIDGNTTLPQLTPGLHNITIYANDTYGNTGTSKTVNFTIAQETEPFPNTPIAVTSAASALVVSAGLIVYFKKRQP